MYLEKNDSFDYHSAMSTNISEAAQTSFNARLFNYSSGDKNKIKIKTLLTIYIGHTKTR